MRLYFNMLHQNVIDKLFCPFYMNFMVKSDKKDELEAIASIITCGGNGNGKGGLEVETITPAHGVIV